MADIKIYGTLKNDTAEPIAYASQLQDTTQGKDQATINAELKASIAENGITIA